MLLVQTTDSTAVDPYDNTLVTIVVVATALIFIVGLIVFGVVAKAAFASNRVGAPKSLGLLFQRTNSLRIATVISQSGLPIGCRGCGAGHVFGWRKGCVAAPHP
jgi:hypothetical protein